MTHIRGPKSNEIGRVVSRPASHEYTENHERVFGKKSKEGISEPSAERLRAMLKDMRAEMETASIPAREKYNEIISYIEAIAPSGGKR